MKSDIRKEVFKNFSDFSNDDDDEDHGAQSEMFHPFQEGKIDFK